MPMQRHKPEQIVTVLRQIEVAMANGKSTPQPSVLLPPPVIGLRGHPDRLRHLSHRPSLG